jgi:biopolymer transport protein ExbD
MIDVLLVILIFLMITTTYSKFSGLEINLPTADAPQNKEQPNEINVVVTSAGEIMVNKAPIGGRDIESIANAMKRLTGPGKEPVVIINADAKAAHQSVIDVMQAAQLAGLSHISFATQQAQR